ncbi:putative WD40/YVTN repeat-like-containing domain, WD40 repeat-like-containing domain protein [Trachipleistophora hominis]|uniref:Putative WD40/YVTN repeat-like-containing domain, WD40 repeat-like-containing domain protein n=1 Tax=Trachipleistophora hominis TaxID=72359 RepID=L7JWC7_TRAHO|nr:putative WD40/YVTN repeat-like-containing domain, WD40 repeat-like-containing domain protein [Trachipleistophora hominis]
MSARKIFFNDKPLCLSQVDGKRVLVSTADCKIYMVDPPYTGKKLLFEGLSPISCVEHQNGEIFFGDWNGCVYRMSIDVNERDSCTGNINTDENSMKGGINLPSDGTCPSVTTKRIKNVQNEIEKKHQESADSSSKKEIERVKNVFIKNAIIKSMKIFNGNVYVGINQKLIIMDKNLQVKTRINLNNKILCFAVINDQLYMGMSIPSILRFNNGKIEEIPTAHQSSILCISTDENGDIVTSSADKTLMVNNRVVYTGAEWIRVCLCLYFTDGNAVKKRTGKDSSTLFVHEGYVVGLQQNEEWLFSIGLDRCLTAFRKDGKMKMDVLGDWDEEEEIKRLNDEFG